MVKVTDKNDLLVVNRGDFFVRIMDDLSRPVSMPHFIPQTSRLGVLLTIGPNRPSVYWIDSWAWYQKVPRWSTMRNSYVKLLPGGIAHCVMPV